MNCTDCLDNLTAYLDSELPPGVKADMGAHLSACSRCEIEAESLKESMEFVQARVTEIELRPDLWDGVYARITELHSPAGRGGFWGFLTGHRWATAMVAVAVFFLLSIGGWRYLQEQQSRKELIEYMTQYVERREAEERFHSDPLVWPRAVAQSELPDNPFLAPKEESSHGNPFLEETR